MEACDSTYLIIMGTGGKAVALSVGALSGMWLGFYLKENYYLKHNKEKRDELMDELQRLRALRKTKEDRLQSLSCTTGKTA